MKAVKPYQEGLNKSGHKGILKYTPRQVIDKPAPKRKPRERQITWFNPPYNIMVRNNIGKLFAKALEKHIPKGHVLHPLLNKHTVKLSYSTMPSMASKVGAHNNKLERAAEEEKNPVKICSCVKADKEECNQGGWKGECFKKGMCSNVQFVIQ